MPDDVPRPVREAAALWADSLIYLSGSDYRWNRRAIAANRHESDPAPPLAAGAVKGRIIPQNRAVKRYLEAANRAGKRHVSKQDGSEYVMDYSLHDVAEELGYRADPALRERVL